MTASNSGLSALLAELKRRRVFRVAAAYVVVAFALLQAADIILPALGLPPWTMTLVVVLAFLGFPVTVVLAWAFDVTPEGVVRTDDAEAAAGGLRAGRASPARSALAGLVVLTVAVGGWVAAGGRAGPRRAGAPGRRSRAMRFSASVHERARHDALLEFDSRRWPPVAFGRDER